MSAALSTKMEAVPSRPAMAILIADDHWVVRESLNHVARGLSGGPIEEASSFGEALAVLERNPLIGLMVIDLMMPGADGFEGLRELRRRFPAIPVVVISVHEDPEHVLEAIRHGVVGYIPKSAGAARIKRALSQVMAGEVSFPREILARVSMPAESEPRNLPSPEEPRTRAEPAVDLSSLTRREGEVLVGLSRGASVADIGEVLGISRQTARVHIGNAMRKLGIASREALIALAARNSDALRRFLDAR